MNIDLSHVKKQLSRFASIAIALTITASGCLAFALDDPSVTQPGSDMRTEFTQEEMDKFYRFCDYYHIDIINDPEVIAEVLDVMADRGWDDVPSTPAASSKKTLSTPRASVSELKSGKVTVTWNKIKNADGYLVKYWQIGSKNSTMKKRWVRDRSVTSKVIRNLCADRKYRIKVYAYQKKKNGTYRYSKACWLTLYPYSEKNAAFTME